MGTSIAISVLVPSHHDPSRRRTENFLKPFRCLLQQCRYCVRPLGVLTVLDLNSCSGYDLVDSRVIAGNAAANVLTSRIEGLCGLALDLSFHKRACNEEETLIGMTLEEFSQFRFRFQSNAAAIGRIEFPVERLTYVAALAVDAINHEAPR